MSRHKDKKRWRRVLIQVIVVLVAFPLWIAFMGEYFPEELDESIQNLAFLLQKLKEGVGL